MITIIFGAPGAGKSSLNAYFLINEYQTEGRFLLEDCQERIRLLNEGRSKKLTLPQRVPIFSDFRVSFKVGYEEWYEPYYLNGYYFALDNERLKPMFLPPFAKIHFGEAQRYYDSRKSKTFPAFVSRAFEMHRHYGIDITMDVQRLNLIDLNVRQIAGRFIEVQCVENTTTSFGEILSSKWYCREFDSYQEVNDYVESGQKTYRETEYIYEGNIFDCFDSFACFSEFLPPEDSNFTFLRHLDNEKVSSVPQRYRKYYEWAEPDGFRTESRPKENNNDKKYN